MGTAEERRTKNVAALGAQAHSSFEGLMAIHARNADATPVETINTTSDLEARIDGARPG